VEIDLILDRKPERHFIEIKTSRTYRPHMARSILQFKKPKDQAIVLYRGRPVEATRDLKVINYKSYLEV
jgi:hypothetical protein